MLISELKIKDAFIINSTTFKDERGSFREWFKASEVKAELGRNFNVAQANVSNSKMGVARGIHYSLNPIGQEKWVTCVAGSIWDVIVDLRPDSTTFMMWEGVFLDGSNSQSVLIGNGLGHAFLSLENNSVVSYLTTSEYSPNDEREINLFDNDIGISWTSPVTSVSIKDSEAETLRQKLAKSDLPFSSS